jgi:NAD(P)H-dependent FMN reductase
MPGVEQGLAQGPARLLVVVASTRPTRVGGAVGEWFTESARAHGGFDVEVADLAKLGLPLLDEPHHPRLRQYVHQHTKDWSATVDAADAIVFVMPEYNHGMTAPLKNAIDHLFQEWADKPLGLVSYGGASGGLRAAQQVKQVAQALRMVVAVEAVSIPFVAGHVADGRFAPPAAVEAAGTAMLDELARLDRALRPLRAAAREAAA